MCLSFVSTVSNKSPHISHGILEGPLLLLVVLLMDASGATTIVTDVKLIIL
ncbi:MAG TPA: hypothetical protein VFZ46_02660 [Nitrososphaeraceae archaeon]